MLSAGNPWALVVLALACASISYTLTKTPAFQWLRARLPQPQNSALGYLWQCPYCMGHWVALLLVLLAQPQPLAAPLLVNLLVATFAVVTLQTWCVQLITLGGELLRRLRGE